MFIDRDTVRLQHRELIISPLDGNFVDQWALEVVLTDPL